MFEDFSLYKEKIEKKDLKINELKEELNQLEKNIEANNRIFMRKYQKTSKPAKKNMFLFHSSRTGNTTIKKQEIIIYSTNLKSYERKKPKSTPKIGAYANTQKNNYFFTNSDKKKFSINFFGNKRGKTLDYKKNKINLGDKKTRNNNINLNKNLFKDRLGQNNINNINNMKQIKINNEISQESQSNINNINNKDNNKYNKTEPNCIIKIINNYDNNYYENLNDKIKNNIFSNKSITNTSSQNSYNNSKINNNRKDDTNKDNPMKIKGEFFNDVEKNKNTMKNEDIYKNVEKHIESVFGQYFMFYTKNKVENNNCQNKK